MGASVAAFIAEETATPSTEFAFVGDTAEGPIPGGESPVAAATDLGPSATPEALAARQATYAFFANVLLTPIPHPGRSFADDLAVRVRGLLDSAVLDEALAADFAAFLAAWEEDAGTCQERLALDRTMLCRCTRPSRVPLPPREGLHRSDQPETATLAALNVFYGRFGSGVAEGVHEAPDYLGIELAFMAELVRCALDATDKDGETEPWVRAQVEFMADHLGRWAAACCEGLAAGAETEAFRGLFTLLGDFLAAERTLLEL